MRTGGGGAGRGGTVAVRVWEGAKNLVFPVQCAGCGMWDTQLCEGCASLAEGPVLSKFLDDDLGLPATELLTVGEYDGELRNVILAAKHDPYRDLSGFLTAAGYALGVAAGESLARYFPGGVALGEQVWVVPAPSSHERRRKRAEIVPVVAQGVAGGLRARLTTRVRTVPAVRLRRGVRGQDGKSAGVRSRGRAGTVFAEVLPPEGVMVVVVDDVVTTGATMRAVFEALGGNVVLAVSLGAA